MSELNVEKVREMLEKTTPGPWVAQDVGEEKSPVPVCAVIPGKEDDLFLTQAYTGNNEGGGVASVFRLSKPPRPHVANARLIAAAPGLARAYLALTAERDALRAAVLRFRDAGDAVLSLRSLGNDTEGDYASVIQAQEELFALLAPAEAEGGAG